MIGPKARMQPRTVRLLVASLIAAIGAALLYAYLANVSHKPVQGVVQNRSVLVAAADIAPRATITAEMLMAADRPVTDVEPDALGAQQQNLAVGAIALIGIPKGATISASRIGRPTQAGLDATLRRGTRALTIPVDRVKSVNGLIRPGDRVDVIAIVPARGPAGPVARTILRDIEVLALGSATDELGATPAPDAAVAATATLEVTPSQADLLALADVNSQLRLALRPAGEPLRSEPVESVDFSIPAASAAPPTAAAPQAGPSMVPRAAGGGSGVQIIDGDKIVSGP